jgi:uncharacterized damage-inducible protein DinB
MLSSLPIEDLLQYTEWQRTQWLDWLRAQPTPVLEMSAGPSADGRFQKIGDLVRHIFSAEKRYIERLQDRPITDAAALPADDLEVLFAFGAQSRLELRQFLEGLTPEAAGATVTLTLGNNSLTATPGKIVTHVLLHEIRHWAQIATLLRLAGLKPALHDFLFSPAMGGELKLTSPASR